MPSPFKAPHASTPPDPRRWWALGALVAAPDPRKDHGPGAGRRHRAATGATVATGTPDARQ